MLSRRVNSALAAGAVHLVVSLTAMALPALFVFNVWYPFPYYELTAGRELFLLTLLVSAVCGPLLTVVLFNPSKARNELIKDLSMVAIVQLAALIYGLFILWQLRPLFLAQEIDRFKIVIAADIDQTSLAGVPEILRPHWTSGPIVVALREPANLQERSRVLLESVQGGRDYAERPEFYLPYKGSATLKSLDRAKLLSVFLQRQPSQQAAATELAAKKGADMAQWLYLPVVARQDWVAVLDKQGQIQGFLKGDGF